MYRQKIEQNLMLPTKKHEHFRLASLAPFYYISFFIAASCRHDDGIVIKKAMHKYHEFMIHTYESNEQRQGHNFSNKTCHLPTKYNCYVSHAKSATFLAALARDYIS